MAVEQEFTMATTDADSVRGIELGEGECHSVSHRFGSGTAPKAPTEPLFSVGDRE
jgi:hypothetical protein